jgi:hypothetical protein
LAASDRFMGDADYADWDDLLDDMYDLDRSAPVRAT